MTRTMHAAIVDAFDRPPHYGTFPAPEPRSAREQLVTVLASGLHPRVRSSADGSHYTSTGALPLIPGTDGVGRTEDGELLYFVLPDTPLGAMAEQTLVDARRSVPLPDGADPLVVAAGMNPAMSSWIALRKRIDFRPGARVLVLGATGNAGRLALEVAMHLGAGEAIGAARSPAAGMLSLDAVREAGDVDVVIDYLWGEPAARAMVDLITAREDRGKALDWIQIGAVAGATAAIPSAALRAANLRIVGSGQGSVGTAEIVAELPALAAQLRAFTVNPVPVPLSEVEATWTAPAEPGARVVFTP